ncbi:MAG: stage III sporulation protein AG [Evtepia sp.]
MNERIANLKHSLARYKPLLLVMMVGVLLLAWPKGEKTKEVQADTFRLEEIEIKLQSALSEIEGAGAVRAVLSVKTGTRQVVAEDRELRSGESEREQKNAAVILSKGSGVEEAVKLQEIYPEFQGALIISGGGDDPTVRLKLMEATAVFTGLGSDKISICKGK